MIILHSADWHARDNDIEEVATCLRALRNDAREIFPDLIEIAGDLSDSQEIRMQSKSAALLFHTISDLARIAPVHIVKGTPSHDGLAPLLFRHIDPRRVWVSDTAEQLYLTDNGLEDRPRSTPKAIISALPAVTKQYFQSQSQSIEQTDAETAQAMTAIFTGFAAGASQIDAPHILAGHWNIHGSHVSDTQILTGREIEVTKDQVAMAEADLVALGHIHLRQQIASNIYFAGSIYRKDWGELEEKGYFVHEVEKGQPVRSTFNLVPTRRLVKLTADLTKRNSFTQEDLVNNANDIENAIVRYEIRVYTDEARLINQAELERGLLEKGARLADIRLQRIPRETVRCERLLRLETLEEKVKAMAEIKNEAVSTGILDKARLLEEETPEAIFDAILKEFAADKGCTSPAIKRLAA